MLYKSGRGSPIPIRSRDGGQKGFPVWGKDRGWRLIGDSGNPGGQGGAVHLRPSYCVFDLEI